MLDAMYDQWVERGASVARAQFPALRHQIRYRSSLTPAVEEAGSVVAWLRLGKPVSGRRVTPITTLFKQAVLSRHQAIHGEPPATDTNWLVSWPCPTWDTRVRVAASTAWRSGFPPVATP